MMLTQLPAVVVALVTWLNAPPATLADAARREAGRRSSAGQSTRVYRTSDLPPEVMRAEVPPAIVPPYQIPAPPPDPAAAAAATDEKAKEEKQDEQWWRQRLAAARQGIERDRVLADGMQSRINALATDIVNRDDPAQRAKLMNDRQRALDELARLEKQIALGELEILKIKDEARRQGVPPGWVR